MQTTRTPIEKGWRVRELIPGTMEPGKVDWIPAQVPGHIHLDLMRAGVIPDPFARMQERACAWVDESDWEYETTFDIAESAPNHAYLRFNGLDTISEIYLNGALLASTDNMFIEHEFAVGTTGDTGGTGRASDGESAILRGGTNTLRIIFRSALRTGRERQQAHIESHPHTHTPIHPHPFVWGPRSFVRKAQYMFGWDWGPELISCGIWKSIELLIVPVGRILNWSFKSELSAEEMVIVHVSVEVEHVTQPMDPSARLTVKLYGIEATDSGRGNVSLETTTVPNTPGHHDLSHSFQIRNPELWEAAVPGRWDSHCYGGRMYLKLGKEVIDDFDVHFGIRKVELCGDDSDHESFRFRVNGQDTFTKGANWIPPHSFPSLSGEQDNYAYSDDYDGRIYNLLVAAKVAGINMLRVWGGGVYESAEFYNICDKLGILVWQDFPYACAYYPDTEEYAAKAEAEARAAVRRLRNHPSLALWCGNNECHQVWHDHWEGKENPAPRFLGEKFYHEILPRVVAEEDPGRAYWPGSPFGGENPNSEDEGDRHNWNVWHGAGDWIHYREDQGRFISEFGFASSCGLNAWDKCLAESDKSPRSPAVRWHDKTRKGYDAYLDLVTLHFPDPVTLEDLVYYTQLNQAEAMKCGIEHWRRNKGRCWGTIFWQLNDCWPAQSWSIIDSELEPKAAYFAVKRVNSPVLLSLLRVDDQVEAHLTSDVLEHIQGDVTISVESFDGDVLMDEKFEAYVDANGTARIGALDVSAMNLHRRDVYVYAHFEPYWDLAIPAVDNFHFLAEPKDLRLANPILTAEIAQNAEGFHLTLNTKRFAPYVWWRFDGIRHTTGVDNHFHLRAGQTRVIPLDRNDSSLEELTASLRIRHL